MMTLIKKGLNYIPDDLIKGSTFWKVYEKNKFKQKHWSLQG